MTVRSSSIRSLVLVGVAACFAEPDIEIRATRDDPQLSINVDVYVCTAPAIDGCRGNRDVFKTMEARHDIFVFVKDDSSALTIKLLQGETDRCVTVELATDHLVRTLHLMHTTMIWSGCSPEPCEPLFDCDGIP